MKYKSDQWIVNIWISRRSIQFIKYGKFLTLWLGLTNVLSFYFLLWCVLCRLDLLWHHWKGTGITSLNFMITPSQVNSLWFYEPKGISFGAYLIQYNFNCTRPVTYIAFKNNLAYYIGYRLYLVPRCVHLWRDSPWE